MTEEETEALLESLGIGWGNPVDALVFDFTEDTNVAGLHVVVVRKEGLTLATYGLDTNGSFVLLRCFTDGDEPEETRPIVDRIGNAVEVR